MLAPAALALVFSAHSWANVVWNVNATFAYNNTSNQATGSFTLDPSLNLVTWDITVTGTHTQADVEYKPSDSISIFPNKTHLDFYDSSTGQYLDLYFSSPLTTSGGSITLLAGDNGADSNSTVACPGCATLVSGSVGTNGAQAVSPEPSSIALCLVGALGIAFTRFRKQRKPFGL
jgi:hypothetical protein